jgi:hypothetical protein
MARVLAISADLMFASKVQATLTAAGHEVTLVGSLAGAVTEQPDLVVADLDDGRPEDLVSLGAPVLGYYSHVNVDTKRAADAAGIDLAVPRSRMAREMPELVEKVLGS